MAYFTIGCAFGFIDHLISNEELFEADVLARRTYEYVSDPSHDFDKDDREKHVCKGAYRLSQTTLLLAKSGDFFFASIQILTHNSSFNDTFYPNTLIT